jgi:NIPSNAP
MDALLSRFRHHAITLFEKHGITNIAYWVAANGDHADRTLIYVLAYPSREARDTMWKAFANDPEWQKAYLESQSDGIKLAEHVESRYMVPTDFSPMT